MTTITDDIQPKCAHEFKAFLNASETKALTTTTQHGEYIVPQHTAQRFEDLLKEYSTIRNIARVDSVSTDSFEILKDHNMADCGWVEEQEDRTETNVSEFLKQKIFIHEIYAKPKISQKILDDALIDIESWVVQKVAEKMALMEDEAFVSGDGIHKPKGFLNYAGNGIDVVEGQGASVFIKAQERLKTRFSSKAVWLVTPLALSYIRNLTEPSTGQFLWQPQFSQSQPATLLGHRVIVCEHLTPDVPVVFGNFYEGYQVVDRMNLTMVRDPYSAKPFVEFYARKRVGGDVINPQAFVFVKVAS